MCSPAPTEASHRQCGHRLLATLHSDFFDPSWSLPGGQPSGLLRTAVHIEGQVAEGDLVATRLTAGRSHTGAVHIWHWIRPVPKYDAEGVGRAAGRARLRTLMTREIVMTQHAPAAPDLKAKHRAMWAMGDYARVASDLIPTLGEVLVEATGIGAGDHVLDVAAGSGNASLPAAACGAQVVASDLTPELFESGRRQAMSRGLALEWREADCEALPFDDGAFDATISCLGVMFAPSHQQSADELVRVTRPGGTIGLLNWTPTGFIGQMFTTMKPYAPPPPSGAQPPPLWGDEEHVRGLVGDRVSHIVSRRQQVPVDRFADASTFLDYFKEGYGPTIAVYKAIADEPDKVRALDEALVDLATRHDLGGGAMEWEYLLLTARRQ